MSDDQKTGTLLDYMGVASIFSDKEQPSFRRGEPAEHPRGVCYRAPWEREGDGFAEHSRRCARALADTGVPTHLRGFTSQVFTELNFPDRIKSLLDTKIQRYSMEVFQVVAQGSLLQNISGHTQSMAYQVHLSAEELRAINTFRTLYSVWERDRIGADQVELLNRFGMVWTACNKNLEMLKKCGVRNHLFRIPIPHFPDDPLLQVAEKKRKQPRKPGPVRFYNIGKWEPRKAQDKIVRCFLQAFKPGESMLFMKTSKLKTAVVVTDVPERGQFPQWITDCIQTAIQDPDIIKNGWTKDNWGKAIQFSDLFFDQDKIVKIHEYGDVYVTLSRGEGFDMPAYDAKIAGNAMVYTPSGGPQDFASLTDWQVPASDTLPCHPFYNWELGSKYLDYDESDVVRALRGAYNQIRLGNVGSADLSRFTSEYVGNEMKYALEQHVQKFGGALV